jgi:hypothetical protein
MRKHSAGHSLTSWRSTGQRERQDELWLVRGREVQSRLRRPPSETSEFPRRSARTLEQFEGAAEAVPRIFRITIPLSVVIQ